MPLLDRFRLDGQVAVVTGAGKGIGAGTALGFAEAGADVVIGARTESDLQAVAAQVEALGRRAIVVPTDVMQPDQLQRLADRAMDAFGRIDILVNNAGGSRPSRYRRPRKRNSRPLFASMSALPSSCRAFAHR